jgi:hypothetical protein
VRRRLRLRDEANPPKKGKKEEERMGFPTVNHHILAGHGAAHMDYRVGQRHQSKPAAKFATFQKSYDHLVLAVLAVGYEIPGRLHGPHFASFDIKRSFDHSLEYDTNMKCRIYLLNLEETEQVEKSKRLKLGK